MERDGQRPHQSQGRAVHRRQARPRRRHRAGPSRRLRLPRSRRRRRRPVPEPARDAQGAARRPRASRASSASTGAAGPKARSSRCSSARTARSSAACTRSAASWFVVAENRRINQDILVPADERGGAKAGEVVVVEIVEQPSRASRSRSARVKEVLGSATDPGIEIEIALRKHELPFEFSEGREAAGEAAAGGGAPRRSQGPRRPHRAAARHHRRRDGEGLRRRRLLRAQGQGLPAHRRDRRRLALRARRRRDRHGRARARHLGLFPAARDPDAAGGAVQRAVLAQAGTSTACAWRATWRSPRQGAIDAYAFYPAVMHSQARLTYTQVWDVAVGRRRRRSARRRRRCCRTSQNLYALFKALARGAREARRDRLRHASSSRSSSTTAARSPRSCRRRATTRTS